jgi:hypothetical protein
MKTIDALILSAQRAKEKADQTENENQKLKYLEERRKILLLAKKKLDRKINNFEC